MKRLLRVIVAVMMAGTIFLSACGGRVDTGPDYETPEITEDWGSMGLTSGGVRISDPGQLPIVENRGDIKVTIMVTGHPAIINWNTSVMSKWMEAMTNIEVEFKTIPLEGRADALNLELASSNYPDAFMVVGIGSSHINRFGVAEGRFLPITDLIKEHAPNLMGIYEKYPNYEGMMTMLNGEIYVMPNINQCYHCTMYYKMWINKEHLAQVGKEMPTTTDELLDVLRAFRDEIPDAIPFAGTYADGWGSTMDYFIMNSFTFYTAITQSNASSSSTLGLYVEDGVVKTPWSEPGTIEGLKYLHMLYDEGLLYEGSLTATSNELVALVESGDEPRVGLVAGGHGMIFSDITGERYALYEPVMPLEGPTGLRQIPKDTNDIGYNGFVVSADSEYPEALVKWADFLYDFTATMNGYYGPEGTNWQYAAEDEIGIDGNPAKYSLLVPWQEVEPQNDHWVQMNISNRDAEFRGGEAYDVSIDVLSPEGLEKYLYDTTLAMDEYGNSELVFPPVKFTEEQSSALSVPLTDVSTIIKQWVPGFIAGTYDIETQYDEFLALLENAGLGNITKAYQDAYDIIYK